MRDVIMSRVFEMKNTLVAVPVRCLRWHLRPTRFRAPKMTRAVAILANQRVFVVISAVTYHAGPIVMNGHILHSISMLHRHEMPTTRSISELTNTYRADSESRCWLIDFRVLKVRRIHMDIASKDISNGSNAPFVTVLLIVNTSSVSGPKRVESYQYVRLGINTEVSRYILVLAIRSS